MIIVKINSTKTGHRLSIKSHNGKKFNHAYNRKADAKRAFDSFVKQIKEGLIGCENF